MLGWGRGLWGRWGIKLDLPQLFLDQTFWVKMKEEEGNKLAQQSLFFKCIVRLFAWRRWFLHLQFSSSKVFTGLKRFPSWNGGARAGTRFEAPLPSWWFYAQHARPGNLRLDPVGAQAHLCRFLPFSSILQLRWTLRPPSTVITYQVIGGSGSEYQRQSACQVHLLH